MRGTIRSAGSEFNFTIVANSSQEMRILMETIQNLLLTDCASFFNKNRNAQSDYLKDEDEDQRHV